MSASLFYALGKSASPPPPWEGGLPALREGKMPSFPGIPSPQGWILPLAETPALGNFASLKHLLPLDSPRSHKL